MKKPTDPKRISGLKIARKVRKQVKADVAQFIETYQVTPKLTAVLVGDDPASQIYVGKKEEMCEKLSMVPDVKRLPADTSKDHLLGLVRDLNEDPTNHGILVQLPLPNKADEEDVLQAIDPDKDVDGLHQDNLVRLYNNRDGLWPCTPLGCVKLLEEAVGELNYEHAVIVGRSNLVGNPLQLMLKHKQYTVTQCHSRSDLKRHTLEADVLIVAAGYPHLITADHVKDGVIVIDVGTNRVNKDKASPQLLAWKGDKWMIDDKGIEYTLVGDVDYQAVHEVADKITPVPGGVGPMTIAMLMSNTLKAAQMQVGGYKK